MIIFFSSDIYCLTFTCWSTMSSGLHILYRFIIGILCFFHLIHIRMVAKVAIIFIDITGNHIKTPEFSHGALSLAGCGDGLTSVDLIPCIRVITAVPWPPKIQVVISAIVVYLDVWDSASHLGLLKCLFRGKMVKIQCIVNMCCFNSA